MRLYLVRHAEAAPGDPDELRPLTQEGRRQARELGKRMLSGDAAPAIVLTSPLLRARETGGELARAFDIESVPDERLAPGASVDDVRAAVESHGDQVVVVGHQPDCGQIAAALTGGPEPRFPAGGLVVLELD
jgi:phosphohistidine phosphatase